MAHSRNTSQGDSTGAAGPVLRAQLAVEPHPDSSCAVVNAGEDAQEVTHHLKTDTPWDVASEGEVDTGAHSQCGECHTEMSFTDDAEQNRSYLKSAVSTHCICPVFEEHDCIPRIKSVRSGSIIVVLTVPRREVLREIITDVRAVGASVSVDWLVNGSEPNSTTEIDVSTITDKQQEAMEVAKEMGYYKTPREADLGDIADALEISESAASQRLNSAETKLVKSFLEE